MKARLLSVIRRLILHCWVRPLDRALLGLMVLRSPLLRRGLQSSLAWARNVGRLARTMLHVYIVRLKGSDWSVIYIGEGYSIQELRHSLFPEPAEVKLLQHVFLWQVPALIHRFVEQGELVVCELNRLFRWQPQAVYAFTTPPWIRQVLDIAQPPEEIIANMDPKFRRILRRAREQNFTYEFSRRVEDFDLFYHCMYLPYITARHEGRVIVEEYAEKLRFFKNGGLLLIKEEDRPVAGILCRSIGNTCYASSMGVLEAQPHLLSKRIATAAYWSLIEWAQSQGLQRIDFSRTRAMLDDGIFHFKRQWGMQVICDIWIHTNWMFLCRELQPALGEFLNKLGFITEVNGAYRGVLLTGDGIRLTEEAYHRAERAARRAGLEGLLILPRPGDQPLIR